MSVEQSPNPAKMTTAYGAVRYVMTAYVPEADPIRDSYTPDHLMDWEIW